MIPVKNHKELLRMQLACHIAAEALKLAGELVKPGVNTAFIDKQVCNYIESQGAKPSFKGYNGFPAGTCISINDTVIHGIPTKNLVVNEGDIVSIDVGAYIDGFHGDNAATYACGEISKEAQRLIDVTRKARDIGVSNAISGNRVGDISAAIQEYVESEGFSIVRPFVGHGVGAKLHEEPEVPNFGSKGRGPRLVSGMTLAIEPMVNEKEHAVDIMSDKWTVKTVDGGLSAHFEHTVAVSASGPVILTKCREAAASQ